MFNPLLEKRADISLRLIRAVSPDVEKLNALGGSNSMLIATPEEFALDTLKRGREVVENVTTTSEVEVASTIDDKLLVLSFQRSSLNTNEHPVATIYLDNGISTEQLFRVLLNVLGKRPEGVFELYVGNVRRDEHTYEPMQTLNVRRIFEEGKDV